MIDRKSIEHQIGMRIGVAFELMNSHGREKDALVGNDLWHFKYRERGGQRVVRSAGFSYEDLTPNFNKYRHTEGWIEPGTALRWASPDWVEMLEAVKKVGSARILTVTAAEISSGTSSDDLFVIRLSGDYREGIGWLHQAQDIVSTVFNRDPLDIAVIS